MIFILRSCIREFILFIMYYIYTRLYKMDINPTAKISFGAKLDKTNPRGVHVDSESYIASGVIIFTHDYSRAIHSDTFIGKKCFIGANSIIMCGVKVADNVIIGAGSVVTKDIPENSIAAGNPARIIRENIKTKKYGQIVYSCNKK